MRIYGIDFTSAPRRRKPITLAVADLEGSTLLVHEVRELEDFAAFEDWLGAPGPWTAGLDFPFGQPRQLLTDLGWPLSWEAYVARIGRMSKAEFEDLLREYRQAQPPGKKHHLRQTDRLAGAVSPMMLYGVPVGKMFFEGAPRLLQAGVSVPPCRPTNSDRITLETYPARIARRAIGCQPYKNDTRSKQTPEQWENRARILEYTQSPAARQVYGVAACLSSECAHRCLEDPTGDYLDAVLCTLPIAWACRQAEQGYGIPPGADSLEGWVIDPGLENQ